MQDPLAMALLLEDSFTGSEEIELCDDSLQEVGPAAGDHGHHAELASRHPVRHVAQGLVGVGHDELAHHDLRNRASAVGRRHSLHDVDPRDRAEEVSSAVDDRQEPLATSRRTPLHRVIDLDDAPVRSRR